MMKLREGVCERKVTFVSGDSQEIKSWTIISKALHQRYLVQTNQLRIEDLAINFNSH